MSNVNIIQNQQQLDGCYINSDSNLSRVMYVCSRIASLCFSFLPMLSIGNSLYDCMYLGSNNVPTPSRDERGSFHHDNDI